MRALGLIFLLAGALSAQQQAPHGDLAVKEKPGDRYIGDDAAIAAGHELYLNVCSGCHGPTAEGGRGPNLITARNARRASNEELFSIIKNGVAGSDMPPSPLPEDQVWQLAAFVRNLTAPAYLQSAKGAYEAGKAIYYGKAGCNKCHMIRGEGGFLGPDLTNVGVSSNMASLQEAVFDPNKRFTDGFRPVIVTMKDGKKIRGVAKNNSNYSIQVLDNGGKLHLLDKKDVKEAFFRDKTWMPDDYAKRLTETEKNDLLAFLAKQAIRPPDRSSMTGSSE
jgi:putative heme-binding domain-containing protein